jgi:NAD(P)-dependent dehydrogenase (short-subunit alcohol dehydrogenase family)
VLERAFHSLGGADIVILAVGVLGARGGLPADIAAASAVLQVNLVGAGSLMMHAARHLRDGAGGTIVVLSSVAGERPRRANAVYGVSKAGARRRQARRRRYVIRVDICLALMIAVTALLLAPGVAIVAVAALLVLAICTLSILLERW